MTALSRRHLLRSVTGLMAFFSTRRLLAAPFGSEADRLLAKASELGGELERSQMTHEAWQEEMARLFSGVDVAELGRALRVDRMLSYMPRAERGASVLSIPDTPFKLFHFEAGRANPPHGHDNMVSMHLVLSGRFRVRHYRRLRDTKDHILIRPTIHRTLGPGEQTSISDDRDNIHWHMAETRGLLLDVLHTNVSPDGPRTRTHLLDPARAVRVRADLLRAPRIRTVREALDRYG